MKNPRFVKVVGVALASLTVLLSQTPTGQITGLVTDASGAVVPAVRVSITNVATRVERDVVSGSEGFYTAPLLQPGKYQIAVEKEGFRPVTPDRDYA